MLVWQLAVAHLMFYFNVDFENAQKMFVKICVRKIEMMLSYFYLCMLCSLEEDSLNWEIHQATLQVGWFPSLPTYRRKGSWYWGTKCRSCTMFIPPSRRSLEWQVREVFQGILRHWTCPVHGVDLFFLSFFLQLLLLYNWIVDQVVEFFML